MCLLLICFFPSLFLIDLMVWNDCILIFAIRADLTIILYLFSVQSFNYRVETIYITLVLKLLRAIRMPFTNSNLHTMLYITLL